MNCLRYRIVVLLGACVLALAASGCVSSPESAKNDEQIVGAVRVVIEAQQAAWNRGDIEGFMDGYERADATTFVSGEELMHGWQTVLERYKQRYNSREQMGTLTFSELAITPISPLFALADGRWQLTRAHDTPRGRFTLIFHRINNDWRIIHDTTTSAGQ
jgi:ketosteroid isomerase-like protein